MFKGIFLLDVAHFALGACAIQQKRHMRCQALFSWKSEIYVKLSSATAVTGTLTLLLLNTACPVLANSVDPDQLASEETN